MNFGKSEVVVFALAVSTAAHVATMFFMEPQVMTRISGAATKTRTRMSARFDRSEPAPPPAELRRLFAPDALQGETAFDEGDAAAPPISGAPETSSGDAAPPAPSAHAPEILPGPESPAVLPPPATPALTGEFDELSVLSIGREDIPSAADEESMPRPAGALSMTGDALAAMAPRIDVSSGPMPELLSPASLRVSAPKPPDAADIKPALVEVSDEIDENIVEREKSAVRTLLDVDDAAPLEPEVSLSVKSASDGKWSYFRIRLSPGDVLKVAPKDVVVLFDASGSIANDRLRSCRDAAREVLRACMNTGDRFNLVAFRDDFEYAFRKWQKCDAAAYAAADKWMDALAAHGRTDVFGSIASVLKLPRDPKRPLIAFVITDGDANTGVSATSRIISRFTSLNDGLVSIYMYGVKKTANRELIDVLTHGNRGEGYVYEGDRRGAGSAIGAMAESFRDPVVSDMRVVFTTLSRAEAFPKRLKNLYRGQSVEIVGRVPDGTREVAFSLKGLNGVRAYEGFFKVNLAEAEFDRHLPADWERERRADAALSR